MSRTYQIYPRGFLGKITTDPTTQASAHVLARIDFQRLSYGSSNSQSHIGKNLMANPAVRDLFNEYRFTHSPVGAFQFYERVLATALDAFGVDDFLVWLTAQSQANTTDYLHAKFLKDTVMFISTGKREMMIDQWLPILSSKHEIQSTVSDVQKSDAAFRDLIVFANEVFESVENSIKSRQIKTVVFDWVSRKNGIADLLKTLNVLFGE